MRLVVVTGVGTGIGKTHLAAALAKRWSASAPIVAYKPVESGVTGELGEDQAVLRGVSTFHVKPPLLEFRLRAPVSPHLAARREGVRIELSVLAAEVARARNASDVIVELPGGLFSPLTDSSVNADLVQSLRPDVTLLVAVDALGVLHNVRATQEACRARTLPIAMTVLTPPLLADASTGQNISEISVLGLGPARLLPRAPVEALAAAEVVGELLGFCWQETAALHLP